GEIESMVGPRQSGFQIAQHGVDGLERWVFGTCSTAPRGMWFVQYDSATYGGETAQTVGDEGGRRCQRFPGELLDGFLGEWPLGQAYQNRLPRFSGLHGGGKLGLGGGGQT